MRYLFNMQNGMLLIKQIESRIDYWNQSLNDNGKQIPFRIENDIAMLHLKSSEGKQLAC